jgi:hypothetical protein
MDAMCGIIWAENLAGKTGVKCIYHLRPWKLTWSQGRGSQEGPWVENGSQWISGHQWSDI